MSSIDETRREFALEVAKRLRSAGFQALWAGGCVRDLLMGESPSDYDIATNAHPDQVTRLFRRTCEVGASFGVVRVISDGDIGDIEIATFRSDGAYIDGRRPETVRFGTAEVDASRRDFTINGMFMDPESGDVIDYVGGKPDLERKILRAIGDPHDRFREDKLRLIRAVRFAGRFGFEIDPATRLALVEMADQANLVAPERIAAELKKMLVPPTRTRAMTLAWDNGLIAAVLPELLPMRGLAQGKPVQPDGDLWDHTLLVLDHLPQYSSFTLAFSALYHDVGKPRTKALMNGKVTFHNHEQVGRAITDRRCRALKLSNSERERIDWLVEYHQYLGTPAQMREATLKRMLASPFIDELLALHRADALASTGDDRHVDYLEHYLKHEPTGPINPPTLLSGHDLARHGLVPGPHFKEILEQIRELQLERALNSKREAIDWVDQKLAAGAWPNARET